MRPLRVLYLDHTAELSGGELALLRLLGALDRNRVTPIVALASPGPLVDALRAIDVDTHVVPLDPRVREARKDALGPGGLAVRVCQLGTLARYARELAAFARAERADLLYANSLKSDLYGALAGRRARVPVIWHVRDRIETDDLPAPAVWLMRCLARRWPACVVANSASTLATLRLGTARPTEVIGSGLTPDTIERCSGPRTASAVARIGLIGRIAPWKGQDVFLRAAAEVLRQGYAARFEIVGKALFGEQAFERRLPALAHELGIAAQVEFRGFQADIPAVLRSLDVLVHASTTPEPFGQVIVEGMAAGLPVIATDGGGAREIVSAGVTGLLVPMGDVAALAAALCRLLARPHEARALGAAGRAHALAHYTVEGFARRSEALYERVVAANGRATG